MLQDYGVVLTDEQADELGASLLRISKIASIALARSKDGNLSRKQANHEIQTGNIYTCAK